MKRVASPVVVLLLALVAAPGMAQGVSLPFAEGTRVRVRGELTIYVVDGGRCRPLDLVAWERLWIGFGGVTEVKAVPAEVRGEALGEGTRLVAAYGTTQIWLVENARIRRRVPSVSAFRAWGFSLGLVEEVPLALLEALPEGMPLADPGRTAPAETGPAFRGIGYEEWWKRFLGAERAERMRAGRALAAFGPHAPEILARFAAAMTESSPEVRRELATFAYAAGPAAVPLLSRALADEDRYVLVGALHALGRIGPAAAPSVPGVVAILDDASAQPSDRWAAGETLAAIGDAHPDVVASLVRHLATDGLSHEIRKDLTRIGRPAAPAVRAACDDPDRRGPGLLVLAEIAPEEPGLVTGLLSLLKDDDLAPEAAELLERRKDLSEAQRAELTAWREENSVFGGHGGHRNLRAEGGGASDAGRERARIYRKRILEAAERGVVSPALAAALADPEWPVRRSCILALYEATFPAAAEALLPALGDPDRAVREAVVSTLANQGYWAIEPLAGLLASDDADARWRAARALEKIARKRVQALDALERYSDDPDPAIRAAVLRARRDAAR